MNANKTIMAFYSPVSGSGKSTACQAIKEAAEAQGLTVELVSFAAPLRKLCAAILVEQSQRMVTPQYAQDILTQRKDTAFSVFGGRTPREHYLIPVGEAVREVFGEDFWVDEAVKGIVNSLADIVLIDDLRRSNEYWALRDLDAKMVQVFRPESDGFQSPSTDKIEGALHNHAFDHTLFNAGTEEELKQLAVKLLPKRVLH